MLTPSHTARKLLPDIHEFIDVLTSPATKMLDRWFESEPLRATLATDAVIGTTNLKIAPFKTCL